ncbi:hypothetical protein BRADI_4g11571v3 [Brachypodium distachyon]|uniref:Uncharacterized protein n=1 Tax=Brachypodium distachyon TaxID=15368 RepID=A0A2K2CM54_BRADI|nr:hypothetical protein BRADI_4g11571v3 [Brachypodium distachyon]
MEKEEHTGMYAVEKKRSGVWATDWTLGFQGAQIGATCMNTRGFVPLITALHLLYKSWGGKTGNHKSTKRRNIQCFTDALSL